MAIQCYFDDSGKQGQADHRHVVIAGYMGHDGSWWNFVQRWKHLLHRHDLPELHLREFPTVAKVRGWDGAKRAAVLSEFVEAVKEAQLIGLGVAVDVNVWRKLSKERQRFFGDGHQFAFQRILRIVADKMEMTGDPDEVWLTFDHDLEFSSSRLKVLDFIRKRDRTLARRFTTITFASARSHYPLQAADLLAWQTRRELANQDGQRPSLPHWQQLFTDLPTGLAESYGELWDKAHIDKGLAAVEADPVAVHRWVNGEMVKIPIDVGTLTERPS